MMKRQMVVSLLVIALVLGIASVSFANQRVLNMEFKDAPLVDVFQILGDVGGYNVLVDPSVQGTVSFYLRDLTVIEALELVAKTTGFSYRVVGNTLVVATSERLIQEFSIEEFSFVFLNNVSVADAQALIGIVSPLVRSYTDAERQLIVLYGKSEDIDGAKVVLEQYDRRGVGVTAVANGEEDPVVDRVESYNMGVYYADGQDILRLVRQMYPSREFGWDGQVRLFYGKTTANEWTAIQDLVNERDLPTFTLRGMIVSGDRNLGLIEYQGSTIVREVGQNIDGWVLVAIDESQAKFARDNREFVVTMGR